MLLDATLERSATRATLTAATRERCDFDGMVVTQEGMITIKRVTTGERRRWISLAVVCMGQLMMVLDATIVNVSARSR